MLSLRDGTPERGRRARKITRGGAAKRTTVRPRGEGTRTAGPEARAQFGIKPDGANECMLNYFLAIGVKFSTTRRGRIIRIPLYSFRRRRNRPNACAFAGK